MYRCAGFFLQFSERLNKEYPSLFGSGGGGEYGAEESFSRKWGWYNSIYALAGGDFLKLSEVETQDLHRCLTWLEHEKEKLDLERKRIKK